MVRAWYLTAAEGGVHVDLHRLDLPGELLRDALDGGGDHPAYPAPRHPQVDQHRHLGGVGDLGEVGVAG
jgi:hypothetical protein